MGKIHQFQMSFVPLEDRILFRLNATGRGMAQFRFWVTRRYAKLLWQGLMKMLDDPKALEEASSRPHVDPPTQAAELEQKHEEAVSSADFKSEFEETESFPLGKEPILLSRLSVRKAEGQDQQLLCLNPEKGNGIEFSLNEKMLHSLCKLVQVSCQKAEWDLKLDFGKNEGLSERGGLN